MSHHAMRTRRQRFARKRRQREAFAAIIHNGGEIVCAPDLFADLVRGASLVGSVTPIRSSPFMPHGHVYAIARQPTFIDVPYSFAARFE